MLWNNRHIIVMIVWFTQFFIEKTKIRIKDVENKELLHFSFSTYFDGLRNFSELKFSDK